MSVTTINPATEEILRRYDFQSDSELDRALHSSSEAFLQWRQLPIADRIRCVNQFAEVLHGARVGLSELMTREMGKPLREALAEVDKCASSCKTITENFPKWRAQVNHDVPGGYSVTREPLGTILGIMPWNFPLWQAVRFAVPTLLCGNSILLKHAPNTWGSAEFIASLFAQAFPTGLFTNLQVDVGAVTRILDDNSVRGVSLTGSVRAGASVAELAGARLKKCVLELGGSDAYVILDDADIDLAAETCVNSRLINTGQSCIAAKRFIVTRKNAAQFTEAVHAKMAKKTFGDPLRPENDLGPMARKDLRDQLDLQVQKSIAAGAKLTLGGKIPAGRGYFYPPTLLVNVRPGMPAFDEELFGPAAAITEAADEKQALMLANHSRYGLGAAVFSKDEARAKALATADVEAGMVFINDFVRSEAGAPFGGVKDSGLGRELGQEGSFEFTNIKTVYVKPR